MFSLNANLNQEDMKGDSFFWEMEFIMMTGWMIQFRLQQSFMNWPIIYCSALLKVCYVIFLR